MQLLHIGLHNSAKIPHQKFEYSSTCMTNVNKLKYVCTFKTIRENNLLRGSVKRTRWQSNYVFNSAKAWHMRYQATMANHNMVGRNGISWKCWYAMMDFGFVLKSVTAGIFFCLFVLYPYFPSARHSSPAKGPDLLETMQFSSPHRHWSVCRF